MLELAKAVPSFLGERSRGRSVRVLVELMSLQELVLLQAEDGGVGEPGEAKDEEEEDELEDDEEEVRMKVSRTRG